jgi:hypothetical protein
VLLRKKINLAAVVLAGVLVLDGLVSVFSSLINANLQLQILIYFLTNLILAGGTLAYAGVYSKPAKISTT